VRGEAREVVTSEMIAPRIMLVTINRPEVLNAVNQAVVRALEQVVRDTEADSDVWVIILTGAGGKAFCSGADLNQVSDGANLELLSASGGFAGFVDATRSKPWIACVNGYAVAGGCELALACDMIVASTTSSFGLPEVKRGLVAGGGGLFRLVRALPRAKAIELVVTGERMSAADAFRYGFINRLAEPEETLNEARQLAEKIVANAPIAVRMSLSIARKSHDLRHQELFKMSYDAQWQIAETEDFIEGPKAFLEKRAPVWSGR
jgi:enoyl-CoA hydratase/carnithine racemase